MVSPSLDDLTGLINITTEQFSYAISVRFIANCFASLAGRQLFATKQKGCN